MEIGKYCLYSLILIDLWESVKRLLCINLSIETGHRKFIQKLCSEASNFVFSQNILDPISHRHLHLTPCRGNNRVEGTKRWYLPQDRGVSSNFRLYEHAIRAILARRVSPSLTNHALNDHRTKENSLTVKLNMEIWHFDDWWQGASSHRKRDTGGWLKQFLVWGTVSIGLSTNVGTI